MVIYIAGLTPMVIWSDSDFSAKLMNYKLNFLLVIGCSLLLSTGRTFGQQNENPSVNDRVRNCEICLAYQDIVVSKSLEELGSGAKLIVILRPGEQETSRQLIRRRIYNLRLYFKRRGARLPSDKVVLAEGEPVSGNGRVEYYINGQLVQQLLFPKNGYICHSCCGPDEDYYPDKVRLVKNKIE